MSKHTMYERKTVIEKLEYGKIIKMLAEEAVSEPAAERIKLLKPLKDFKKINILQQQTVEAYEVLRQNPEFSLRGFSDISTFLKKAELGISLEPSDFLKILSIIRSGAKVKGFFDSFKKEYVLIFEQVGRITGFKNISDKIEKSISSDGTVADDATPKLKSINRSIIESKEKIKTKLQGILSSSQMQKKLQEQIVTIRNERYVVPVKQEYVSAVPGLVHDHSSSGATVFIEPMAVVELNNKLKQLVIQRSKEEERILSELTAEVAMECLALSELQGALVQLDIFFSKAQLAYKLKATRPVLNEKGIIVLKKARHPLINPDEVVPIDFWLGNEFSMVIITGPNTGGKTVALKTVGLFTLLAQTGLFIPAEEESQIAVVDEVYADIGDEQSLEQSLSTFSSHMTNIVEILNKASSKSLILFDELGAGTDPIEGAALARAILEYVHSRGSLTIATTHYGALKHFAFNTDRIENASVEFDLATLRPTYRLLMGLPGKSNAFEISERLGLKHEVIENAKTYMDTDEIEVGDLIQSLEKTRIELENEKNQAQEQRKEAEKIRKELEDKENSFKQKEAMLMDKAKAEAKELVKRTKVELKEIINDLKLTKEIQEQQNRLKKINDELANRLQGNERTAIGEIPKNLKPGDEVYVPKVDKNGVVLSYNRDSKEATVQLGIMKITARSEELRIIKTPAKKNEKFAKTKASLVSNKSQTISSEIDVRGLNSDEAIGILEKYLDDAVVAGLNQVSLIHGKGTGVLARNIHEYLKQNQHIAEFRFGKYGEGDSGVTIVKF